MDRDWAARLELELALALGHRFPVVSPLRPQGLLPATARNHVSRVWSLRSPATLYILQNHSPESELVSTVGEPLSEHCRRLQCGKTQCRQDVVINAL